MVMMRMASRISLRMMKRKPKQKRNIKHPDGHRGVFCLNVLLLSREIYEAVPMFLEIGVVNRIENGSEVRENIYFVNIACLCR